MFVTIRHSPQRATPAAAPAQRDNIGAARCPRPCSALLAPAGMVLLAFALRAYRLHTLGDFDFDEVASVWYAGLPLNQMLAALAGAIFEHPPLYYLLLKLWIAAAGSAEYPVRFLSVPLGTLAVAALYALARRLFDRRSALAAALLMAVSPLEVFYSREARMYALVTLLVLLAAYWLARATVTPTGRTWAGYGACAVAALYAHYLAAFVLLALNAWYLVAGRRSLGQRWLLVHGLALGLALPWLATARGFGTSVAVAGRIIVGPADLLAFLDQARVELIAGLAPPSWAGPAAWLWYAGWGGLVVLVWGRAPAVRRGLALPLLAGAGALLGLVALVLVNKYLQTRYLLLGLPFLYLALAAPVVLASRRPAYLLGATALGALVFLPLPLAGLAHYLHGYVRGDYGAIVQRIEDFTRPGDAVVMTGPWQYWLWRHYARTQTPYYLIPRETPPPLSEPDAERVLRELPQRYSRVWLSLAATAQADPTGFVERWLDDHGWRGWQRGYRDAALRVYSIAREPMPFSEAGVSLDNVLRLTGYRLDTRNLELPEVARITLEYEVLRTPAEPLNVSVRLTAQDGQVYQHDLELGYGRRPAPTWRPGERIAAQVGVWLPPGAPPREYKVYAVVYGARSGRPLGAAETAIMRDSGLTVAQGESLLYLGRVHAVKTLAGVPDWDLSGRAIGARFGGGGSDQIALLAVAASRQAAPGGQVEALLTWRAERDIAGDYAVLLALVSPDGRTVAQGWSRPVAGAYDTWRWRAGELLRDRRVLQVPKDATSGRYALRAGLLRTPAPRLALPEQPEGPPLPGPDGTRTVAVATIDVRARPRLYTPPRIAHPRREQIGDIADLLGYDLDRTAARPGEVLHLTLYWRARPGPGGATGTTDASYTVFTHLLGPDGRVYAQQDNPPQRGEHPTSAWLAGEIVVDRYELRMDAQAPAGEYELEIGMYDPRTGVRLPVLLDGVRQPDDRIVLARVQVTR
jgi:hypothetical protein